MDIFLTHIYYLVQDRLDDLNHNQSTLVSLDSCAFQLLLF